MSPFLEVDVEVVPLPHARDLPLPSYETEGASGMDLRAAIPKPMLMHPGEQVAVPTGLTVALPPGCELQIRPRSGLAAKHGVTVLNSPGTIDADYRGEIVVLLINHSKVSFAVEPGMRIAQAVLAPVMRCRWRMVGELGSTERGDGGFGSTGAA